MPPWTFRTTRDWGVTVSPIRHAVASPLRRRIMPVAIVAAAVIAVIVVLGLPAVRDSSQPTPAPSLTAANTEIFPGGLYVDPTNEAAIAEAEARDQGRSSVADRIAEIAEEPTAIWIGDWTQGDSLASILAGHRARAEASGTTMVFVLYAIPARDCGNFSAGGLTAEAYLPWVAEVAEGLRGSSAVVLLEPDSLAMLTNDDRCEDQRAVRTPLLSAAVDLLADAGIAVYLDAGNSNWAPVDEIVPLLREAGVDRARGFFTNVSNFYRVDEERAFADGLSAELGGSARFVIDVSRNGDGWQGDWCNPPGAALGQDPGVTEGTTALDALLWVKHPGQSDGTCNGGPTAGAWWEEYALDLVAAR